MPPDLSNEAPGGARYAYKASLFGAAYQFELTEQGLSWRIAGRSGLWRYADIGNVDGARLSMLSTSWQTAALMTPQDRDYRTFITELHAHLAKAGSAARLTGGLGSKVYGAAILCVTLVAFAMTGLLLRAVATGEWAGALFLVGFAALFAWQVGGFITRNRPLTYSFGHIPEALLP